MLRLNPRYKRQIPNGLAIFAAFLLGASTLAGFTPADPAGDSALDTPAVAATEVARQAAAESPALESPPQAALQKSKRFKVNLFLFRR